MSIVVGQEVMYRLSEGIKTFDLKCPSKAKGQGPTLESLKSNISEMVQDKR